MKKSILIAAVMTTCTISSAYTYADDGRINFIGKITDTACTITNNTTNPLDVTLGTVSKTAFTGAGSTAAPTKFVISLTDCPVAATSATVKFDGTSANAANTALKLTDDAEVAKGVGIQLSDATGGIVPLYSPSQAYTLNAGNNGLDFVARYVALSETKDIESGSANSTAQFTILYN